MSMTIQRTLAAMSALLLAAACGPSVRNKTQPPRRLTQPLPSFPPVVDAPFELARRPDREHIAARYSAMELTDPKRAALRLRLADEYARQLKLAIADKKTRSAYDNLSSIARLWTAAELRGTPADITRYVEHAKLVRAELARAGDDKRALTVLAMLIAADPANEAKHRAEIAEVLKFGDEVMISVAGKLAKRARPIEALQHAAERWPTPFVVDTTVGMFKERQQVVSKGGTNFRMLRAHGMSIFHTNWHIVRLYARAGRLAEALPTLLKMKGIGGDRDLTTRLKRATRKGASASDWVRLSKRFQGITDKRQKDFLAVLGIIAHAQARFPKNATLYMEAGAAAEELDEPLLAARHYAAAFSLAKSRKAAGKLAALHNRNMDRLLFGSRPQAARAQLKTFEVLHAEAIKRWPNKPLATDLAVAYATIGRGFAGLGELSNATTYLRRSIKQRPTLRAYEMIAQIALKRNDHDAALATLARALKLPAKNGGAKLMRAGLLALGVRANKALNKKTTALQYAFAAIDTWSKLLDKYKLPLATKAQLFIDWGQVSWTIGRKKQAIQLFETVVGGAAKREINARILSSMVSFLIVRGHYDLAVDAYYRVLGSHKADPEQKVYMSLWVVAEALRTKRAVDPLASAYLASRKGSLWYDDLARLASGRTNLKTLSGRATTRARRAELLYYAAMLKTEAADTHKIESMMRGVIDTQVVLFFEYDMAKLWLNRRIGRASPKH